MSFDPTIPLLFVLALLNAGLAWRRAGRRAQLAAGAGLVALAAVLLKDWIEGLVYLARMP